MSTRCPKTLYITSLIEHLRCIDGEYGEAFRSIQTIQRLGRNYIYLSGLKGRINRKEYAEFWNLLESQGVKRALFERHGELLCFDVTTRRYVPFLPPI